MILKKIVSGGQTGVDRAALDVAIELGIPHGGWCPKGRLSESGTIPNCYNLQETDSSEYSERTKLNIKDSDGTLIFVPNWPLPDNITDGTRLTIQEAEEKVKPYLIIDLSNGHDAEKIIDWIKKNNIEKLNVAGPRESQSRGIYQLAYRLLENIINLLRLGKTDSCGM